MVRRAAKTRSARTFGSAESRTPVIGILPEDFGFLEPDVKVWLPIAFTAAQKSDASRHSNNWSYLARLKPGRTVAQARAEIDALNARNLDRFPALKAALINAGFHTVVLPLQDYLVRDLRSTLYLLWGGVVFVLLIGAVNIANLMLVRSSARMKEMATRHALGAGLARIGGQLMIETLMLTAAGGVLGLGLGYAGVRVLGVFGMDATPQGTGVTIDADNHRVHGGAGACGRRARRRHAHRDAASPQSQPGLPRGRTQRHRRARRTRDAPRAGRRAGDFRLHVADRRRLAADQLPARARRAPGLRSLAPAHRDRQPAGGAVST